MNLPSCRLPFAVLVCLAYGCGDITAAQAPVQSETPPDATFSTDGGLTRNSLEEAAQAPPPVSSRPPRRVRREVVVRSRRDSRAVERQSRPSSGVVRYRQPRRRNLFVSFVYAWNGWVIHTFHTTKGTVMLKRIGFKG